MGSQKDPVQQPAQRGANTETPLLGMSTLTLAKPSTACVCASPQGHGGGRGALRTQQPQGSPGPAPSFSMQSLFAAGV